MKKMDLPQVLFLLKILSFTEATYYAREYFFSYPFQRASLQDDNSEVTIYNPNDFQVNINARRALINSLDVHITIPPDETRVISTAGNAYQMDKESGIFQNGIIISSTADVIVFAAKIISKSSDAFVVPSSIRTGTKFVSVTAFASPYVSFLAVCSTHDDTRVRFMLPSTFEEVVTYDGVSYRKAEIIQEVLHKFQCLQIVELTDLTGIYIESTKKITVLSGAENYKIEGGTQDYVVSSIPPLAWLGTFYIIQPFGTDLIKIVNPISNSIISINGPCLQKYVALQRSRESREYQFNCLISITANKPILVAHFPMPSPKFNPAMYIVTPMERYRESIMVYTPVSHTSLLSSKCTIFVTANTTNISTILVRTNIQQTFSWTRVQGSDYDYAYMHTAVMDRKIKFQSEGLTLGGYAVCESEHETAAVPFVSKTYLLTDQYGGVASSTFLDTSEYEELLSVFHVEMISSTAFDQNGVSTVRKISETFHPVINATPASTFSTGMEGLVSTLISLEQSTLVDSKSEIYSSHEADGYHLSSTNGLQTFATTMEGLVSTSQTISVEQSILVDSKSEIFSSHGADGYHLSSMIGLQIPVMSSTYIKTTESAPQNYTQEKCACDYCTVALSNSSQELNETSLREVIEKLQQELTVNKKTTSTWLRSKNSADDNRPSAKGIGGTLCIITVCIVFGIIIVPDIITLSNYLRQKFKNGKGDLVV